MNPKNMFWPGANKHKSSTGAELIAVYHIYIHSNVSGPQDFDADLARDTVDGAQSMLLKKT